MFFYGKNKKNIFGVSGRFPFNQKFRNFSGGGANGKEIFQNLISEFWVYLVRLSQYSGKSD